MRPTAQPRLQQPEQPCHQPYGSNTQGGASQFGLRGCRLCMACLIAKGWGCSAIGCASWCGCTIQPHQLKGMKGHPSNEPRCCPQAPNTD